MLWLLKQVTHRLAVVCLSSLMGLIIDDNIPVHIKDGIVLFKFAACAYRAAKILH